MIDCMETNGRKIDSAAFVLKPSSLIMANLDKVSSRIKKLNTNDFINKELYLPSTHLFGNPGKLLRSAFIFATAGMLGERQGDFIDLAASIELLHTASLVHDDIIDRDSMRRGVQAVHAKFGVDSAILAGDALIAKAIQLAAPYGEEVINAISRAAMNMCAGEMLDYSYQAAKEIPNVTTYLRIAKHKSAALIATSMSIIDIYKKGRSNALLYKAGESLGMAFQIRDDIMNFMGIEDLSKKTVNSDAARFRPNIVSTVGKHLSLDKASAVKRSININNSLVSECTALLTKVKDSDEIVKYANTIKIPQVSK